MSTDPVRSDGAGAARGRAGRRSMGFFVLALFGLQYSGPVEIRWGLLEQRSDALSQAAAAVWAMRYLPSAGAAAAGVVAGWWRRKW